MSKHTPGPWRYWTCTVDNSVRPPMYYYAQFANQNGHVFRIPLAYLSKEDADLIAAAPELLELLQEATDYTRHPDYEWPVEFSRRVRATIAKAIGEQQ